MHTHKATQSLDKHTDEVAAKVINEGLHMSDDVAAT
jgi:hypothetical protein